jgi:hypothetical protein
LDTGGIEVVLFWDRATDALTVSVFDRASGDAFDLPVAPREALNAFHHPYAHAASRGIQYRAG